MNTAAKVVIVSLIAAAGSAVLAVRVSSANTTNGGAGFRTSRVAAYLTLTGKTHGPFVGGKVEGIGSAITLLGYEGGATAQGHGGGGGAGKVRFQDITVTKEIDSASPQLFNALTKGEDLQAEVNFVGINARNEQEILTKVKLANVHVTDIRQSMTTPCIGAAPCAPVGPDANIVGPDQPTETIALSFESIEIHANHGTSFSSELTVAK
jgi:type VI secretion system Hcp family effector